MHQKDPDLKKIKYQRANGKYRIHTQRPNHCVRFSLSHHGVSITMFCASLSILVPGRINSLMFLLTSALLNSCGLLSSVLGILYTDIQQQFRCGSHCPGSFVLAYSSPCLWYLQCYLAQIRHSVFLFVVE